MRVVSPILKKIVYPAMSGAGVFRRTSLSGLAVVTYHGVLPRDYTSVDPVLDGNLVSADSLRRQIRLIRTDYNLIAPEDFLEWRRGRAELPARAVLLTCDDGLLNCLTDMLPVLHEEDVKCLFFVTGASAQDSRRRLWYEDLFLLFLRAPARTFRITCEEISIDVYLGSPEQRRRLWWDSVKRLSRLNSSARDSMLAAVRQQLVPGDAVLFKDENSALCRRFGMLTPAEIQQLAAAGMTVGAHTMSHPILALTPSEVARSEIMECKKRLESLLQKEVWALAYPFGDHASVTQPVIEMAQEAGFEAAFLNYGGGLGASLPWHALPRVHMTADMRLSEFDAHLSGFYLRLRGESVSQSQTSRRAAACQ